MPPLKIPLVIVVLFMIDLGLAVIHILIYLLGDANRTLLIFLGLDRESNIPTWYSSMQWFSAAALSGIFAFHNLRLSRGKSWHLLMLPLVFLAFSLDEVAQIHEALGETSDWLLPGASRKNSLFPRTGIWMFVLGVPFLAVFVGLIFTVRRYFQSAPGALIKICLGMAIFLFGAIGIETLSNFVYKLSPYYMLLVVSEELCELLGSTTVLWGSYELLYKDKLTHKFEKVDTRGE